MLTVLKPTVLVLSLVIATAAAAQQGTTELRGTVRDVQGVTAVTGVDVVTAPERAALESFHWSTAAEAYR